MTPAHATAASDTRDRGAVDVSIEMLFGTVAVLMALLLVFETVAYWHARNVFDDAASDAARVAAAYDGDCAAGVEVARAAIAAHAGGWADDVQIACTDAPMVTITITGHTPGVVGDAPMVTITITGHTPGVVGDALGMRASVTETAPKEQ